VLTGVAHFIDLSIRRHHTDSKPFGIGFTQFGNVIGDLPLSVFQERLMKLFQDFYNGRLQMEFRFLINLRLRR